MFLSVQIFLWMTFPPYFGQRSSSWRDTHIHPINLLLSIAPLVSFFFSLSLAYLLPWYCLLTPSVGMHSHPALRFSQLLLLVATFLHATRIPTLPYLPAEVRVWDASCARHCVQTPLLMAHNPCAQPDLRGDVALDHIQRWGQLWPDSVGLNFRSPILPRPPLPLGTLMGCHWALTLPPTPQYCAPLPCFTSIHTQNHYPWRHPLLDSTTGWGDFDTRLSLHHTPTTTHTPGVFSWHYNCPCPPSCHTPVRPVHHLLPHFPPPQPC